MKWWRQRCDLVPEDTLLLPHCPLAHVVAFSSFWPLQLSLLTCQCRNNPCKSEILLHNVTPLSYSYYVISIDQDHILPCCRPFRISKTTCQTLDNVQKEKKEHWGSWRNRHISRRDGTAFSELEEKETLGTVSILQFLFLLLKSLQLVLMPLHIHKSLPHIIYSSHFQHTHPKLRLRGRWLR